FWFRVEERPPHARPCLSFETRNPKLHNKTIAAARGCPIGASTPRATRRHDRDAGRGEQPPRACYAFCADFADRGCMARKPYPSDVTDAEWAFIAPYLTLMREDAPQREHPLRELLNGVRWVVRTGGQ